MECLQENTEISLCVHTPWDRHWKIILGGTLGITQSKSQTFLLQTQAIIDEWLHIWKWAGDLVSNQTFHLASIPGFLSDLEPRPFVWLQTWTCPLYGSESRLFVCLASNSDHWMWTWVIVAVCGSNSHHAWPPYRQVTPYLWANHDNLTSNRTLVWLDLNPGFFLSTRPQTQTSECEHWIMDSDIHSSWQD